MDRMTKTWTQSKIMIRALLVMIIGIIGAVIPFLTAIGVDLAWLNKIAQYLTEGNVDAVLNWMDLAVGVIAGLLGLSIWVERKKSQGEKIAGKNATKFPREYKRR